MEILEESHEEERNGKKEHVTFAIYQKRIRKIDEGPPTFVAQTRKHSEQQLNKEVIIIALCSALKCSCHAKWFKYSRL